MGVKMIDGLPIINAKKAIKLIVTDRDVKRADKKQPNSCAVALACSRQLHAKEVRVHLGRVYVRTNEQNWQRYITSQDMRTEIIAFDRGGTFVPGEFTLPAPSPAKQTGKRQGTEGTGKVRRKVRPQRPHKIVQDVRVGPAAETGRQNKEAV